MKWCRKCAIHFYSDPSPVTERRSHMPSKALIVGVNKYKLPGSNLQGCVNDATNVRDILFHFSGHGSQIRDRDGDELKDHLDEIICPHDMDWDGTYIVDDDRTIPRPMFFSPAAKTPRRPPTPISAAPTTAPSPIISAKPFGTSRAPLPAPSF